MKVAVLVGSLRKESLNLKMAKHIIANAPAQVEFRLIDINLPLYNEDLDTASPPESWQSFRQNVRDCEAVLFVTPEYNRSVPGGLKNAIDVGSRPFGKSVFSGKPGAVISLSPGSLGGFGSNVNLRQSMMVLNMPVMGYPEAYIGGAGKLFDEKGQLTDEKVKDLIAKYISSFVKWVTQTKA